MEKITKVKLSPKTEENLAAFMAKEGIGPHDKNAVIGRAVEIYLQLDASKDTGLYGILEERHHSRSEKGKEIWQRSKPPANQEKQA
jgi:hypothetical protein